MKRFYKLVAEILIVTMAWMPFSIQAGMIGTDQVVVSAQDQLNRDTVLNFVTRSDVTRQLEMLGLSASTAKERVSAMTQEEVNRIAGQIDALPAGATSGWAVAAVVLVIFLVWWFAIRR